MTQWQFQEPLLHLLVESMQSVSYDQMITICDFAIDLACWNPAAKVANGNNQSQLGEIDGIEM